MTHGFQITFYVLAGIAAAGALAAAVLTESNAAEVREEAPAEAAFEAAA